MSTSFSYPLIYGLCTNQANPMYKVKELHIKTLKNGKELIYVKDPANGELFLIDDEKLSFLLDYSYLNKVDNIAQTKTISIPSGVEIIGFNLSINATASYTSEITFLVNDSDTFKLFLKGSIISTELLNAIKKFKEKETSKLNLYVSFDYNNKKASLTYKEDKFNLDFYFDDTVHKLHSIYKDTDFINLKPGRQYKILSHDTSVTNSFSNNLFTLSGEFKGKTLGEYPLFTLKDGSPVLVYPDGETEGYLFTLFNQQSIFIDPTFFFKEDIQNLCSEIFLPSMVQTPDITQAKNKQHLNFEKIKTYFEQNEEQIIQNFCYQFRPLEFLSSFFRNIHFIKDIDNRKIIYSINPNLPCYFYSFQGTFYYPNFEFAKPIGEIFMKNNKIDYICLFSEQDVREKNNELSWNPFTNLQKVTLNLNKTMEYALKNFSNIEDQNDIFKEGKKNMQFGAKKVLQSLLEDLRHLAMNEIFIMTN